MAELGLAVNIVDLAATAIRIIQQVRQAYEDFKNLPSKLAADSGHLKELLKTLEAVKETAVLQTDSIAEQIQLIASVAGDIQGHLQRGIKLQQKSSRRRYIRIFLSGTPAEKDLIVLFNRLNTARDELSFRIQLVHVNLTAAMSGSNGTTRVIAGQTVPVNVIRPTSNENSPPIREDSGSRAGHTYTNNKITGEKTHKGNLEDSIPKDHKYGDHSGNHTYNGNEVAAQKSLLGDQRINTSGQGEVAKTVWD